MAHFLALVLALMAALLPANAELYTYHAAERSLKSDWACQADICTQDNTATQSLNPVLTPLEAKTCLQRHVEAALASATTAGTAAPAEPDTLNRESADRANCPAPLLFSAKAHVATLRGAAQLQHSSGLGRMLAEWHVYPVSNSSASAPSPMPLQEVGKNGSVHCCCGLVQLKGTTGADGLRQLCCCGTVHECCQPSSGAFCDVQNCTAIMVGAITFAAALTALSVSAVWVTRYLQLRQAASLVPVELHVERRPVRRRTRPLPVLECDEAEEGKARDCPICLEEVTSNTGWTKFSCTHGTCSGCYARLCEGPFHGAACPLCRTLLVEEIQTEPEPEPVPEAEVASEQTEATEATIEDPALRGVLQEEDRQDSAQPLTSAMVSSDVQASPAVTSSSRD